MDGKVDMMLPRMLVYDHLDSPLFEIDPTMLIGAVMSEEVNGEHSLSIETRQELAKGQRIFCNDGGKVKEFVVLGDTSTSEQDGAPHVYHCVWSLQYDLSSAYIADRRVGSSKDRRIAADALAAIASVCRWQVGTVTSDTLSSAWFYYTSCWDALSRTVKLWRGEVDATITIGDGEIVRRIDFYGRQGSSEPTRRFEYAHDTASITRTILDDLFVCRIVPRGKGEQVGETESGDPTYGRRITIKGVNGGVEYLQDDDAAAIVRVPNGDGYDYPTSIVVYEDIETSELLLETATADLESYTRPKVSYEADVSYVGRVSLGDTVHVVDRTFGKDGLRIEARAMGIERNLLDPSRDKITVGNFRHSIADTLKSLSSGLAAAKEQVEEADGKAGAAIGEASAATQLALGAQEAANAIGQHFWHDEGGAHVTEVTEEQWNDQTGPLYRSGMNSLWNAQGMLFRDALTNRLAITAGVNPGIAIFDGAGNGSGNILAMLGQNGARIGRDGSSHISITGAETVFHDAEGSVAGRIAMSDESVLIKTASYSLNTVGASWVHDTVTGLSPVPSIGIGVNGAILMLSILFDGTVIERRMIRSLSEPPISITVETTDVTFQTTQDGDTWGISISARNREVPERVVTVTFDMAWGYIGTAPTFAFGDAESKAPYAFSAGEGLDAQGPCQAVFGRHNVPSRTDLLIVGNGTEGQRSNAFSVDSQGTISTQGYFQQAGMVGLGPEAQQGWWEAIGVKSLIVFREASSSPTAIGAGALAHIKIQCPTVDGYTCVGAMQMWHSTSSGSGNVILGFPYRSDADNKLSVTVRANSASTITVKAYLMYLKN